MILAWLLPVVLILRAGLVMAQDVDSANLGINMYAKGEVSNEHLTKVVLTNSHSVQRGYNGWTRRRTRRDGENARFEHRTKNGIWELTRSRERDPVRVFREELIESIGNKNQKKAVPILATDNKIVKKSVDEPSPTLPSPPPSQQLSSPSPSPSSSSDTVLQKYTNSLPPKLVTDNSTRPNGTTTNNTSDPSCSPNLPDYCINRNCTAADPNCLIIDGNAGCFPRTLEGWRLSSCPESLSFTGPSRKENETCVLLTTPTDIMTLTKLLSVILKTTNVTDEYSTDGYSTELLKDYGNCDPSLYCDSKSTPSICRPKLATETECESSNQCQSGRCLEKQDGTGPKVCLGTDEDGDQPSASTPSSSDGDDYDDSDMPVHSGDLKLILTTVLPVTVGMLIIIFLAILIVRVRRREMSIRHRQVSYPKEIPKENPFQDDSPRTTWTNLSQSFTTIRESIIRFSQFSRMTDTDDRERHASAVQQQRRDSNRHSILLPPPPKLTNSLMWMQTPHPLKPVYERIRALRSSPPLQEDFGIAEQNPSGLIYTPAFASSSDSERIYQRYI